MYENPGLLLALRTAKAWGTTPTGFFNWPSRDQTLAKALTYYEATLGDHGLPAHISGDPLRLLEVDKGIDFAARKIAEARQAHEKTGASTAGIVFTVIDKGYPDDDD